MDKASLNVAITGSSGLVGKALLRSLSEAGHRVVSIVRAGSSGIKWDPYNERIEREKLSGINAFIHLSGENIASGRWTVNKKREILLSRTIPTTFLSKVISSLPDPKPTLLCASAIGIYGDRGDELLTEASHPGLGFFPEVALAWENSTLEAKKSGSRTLNLRFGVVLDPSGGALGKMLLPFKLGLGGPLGLGDQYMSWISIDDLTRSVSHLLGQSHLSGPINITSSESVTNEVFTKTLGKVLGRPTPFRIPKIALRLLFGELADAALLSSARVVPKALLDDGFKFSYPNLEACLTNLLKPNLLKHGR